MARLKPQADMTAATRLIPRRDSVRQLLPELKEIRERRLKLRISQRDLAKNLGVSQSIIAKIEKNRVSPSYALVKKVFSYLDSMRVNNSGKASDIVSKPIMSVQIDDAVQRAMHILQTTGYKQIPVRDGELWVGCVYERTISKHMLETNDPRLVLRRQVGQIMDEGLPTAVEETPVVALIPLLQQHQAVLVTRKGRVTGIITNADLLKLIS